MEMGMFVIICLIVGIVMGVGGTAIEDHRLGNAVSATGCILVMVVMGIVVL